MENGRDDSCVREAVGVFEDAGKLQAAIDDLLTSGFDRSELSLLAAEQTVEEKLHGTYRKVTELEDRGEVPRTAYVSTETVGDVEGAMTGGLIYVGATVAAGAIVASGGTLAAAIAGAVVFGGTGGALGTILAKWFGDHHAHYLKEQLDHGGLLLWVRTVNKERERRASEILRLHSGLDVHIHELPAETGSTGPRSRY